MTCPPADTGMPDSRQRMLRGAFLNPSRTIIRPTGTVDRGHERMG